MSASLVVIDVLKGVLQDRRSLTECLAEARALYQGDQWPFIAAMCYGILRYRLALEYVLRKLLSKGLKGRDLDLRIVLLLGLYQLRHSQRPPHAVVNEAVKLPRKIGKEWGKGLVNGVLRNYLRQREALEKALSKDKALSASLPGWLQQSLEQDYPQTWRTLAENLLEQAPMTLRVNVSRISTEAYALQLAEAGITAVPVPGLPQALSLEKPCDVSDLPGFDEGLCSVQDSAAQWVAQYLSPREGERVLDACSAPGGKGAACLEQAGPGLELWAVDIDVERQEKTREGMRRLQLQAHVLTADVGKPSEWWDGKPFDRIILDAPCSATGVIRRHPDIKFHRQEKDIPPLVEIQAQLLDTCWTLLKPGGLLLYATCSLLQKENSGGVSRFLRQHTDAQLLPLPQRSATMNTNPGLQSLPQSGGQDGFYYALIQKVPESVA